MQIEVALEVGRSDKGRTADANDDRILELPEFGLFAIADGEGGADGADRTLATLRRSAPRLKEFVQKVAANQSSSVRLSIGRFFERIFQRAGDGVHDHARRSGQAGLSSTLLAAVFAHRFAYIAHVGHTRAYMMRDDELWTLTTDHTVAAQKLERGQLSEADYASSDERFKLTQALGVTPRLDVAFAEVLLSPGDVLLLCSDGLPRHVTDADIADVLARETIDTAAQHLVDLANERGGTDNVSVIAIRMHDEGPKEFRRLDVAATMRKVWLFEGLRESDRMRLAPYLEEAVFGRDEVICLEGEPGNEFYVIVSGEVRVEKGGTKLTDLGPGSHFGEISLVHGGRRTADVIANEETVAYALSRQRFEQVVQSEPEIGVKLMQPLIGQLAARVADLSQKLVDAGV